MTVDGVPGTLASIATLRRVLTRSISAENPSGSPGAGGRASAGPGAEAARDLGVGWKISPCIDVPPGDVADIASIEGPGVITHIWMTTQPEHWRSLILRAHWDEADEPAIEVPLGDFFCSGWGRYCHVNSLPVAVNPHGGFNSYWPMPFRRGARLSLANLGHGPARIFFQVSFEVGGRHNDRGYLHCQWRRSNPLEDRTPHTLLESVEGWGQYVGTYLAWAVHSPGWWGEGEVKFFMDADREFPTICGTGTEDYFGGAWNFDVPGRGYTEYSTAQLGMPQVLKPDGLYDSQQRFGLYRWHLADPIHFAERLRVTIQALGWRRDGRYRPLRDDIASTAWFYLDRPATARPLSPTAEAMEP